MQDCGDTLHIAYLHCEQAPLVCTSIAEATSVGAQKTAHESHMTNEWMMTHTLDDTHYVSNFRLHKVTKQPSHGWPRPLLCPMQLIAQLRLPPTCARIRLARYDTMTESCTLSLNMFSNSARLKRGTTAMVSAKYRPMATSPACLPSCMHAGTTCLHIRSC